MGHRHTPWAVGAVAAAACSLAAVLLSPALTAGRLMAQPVAAVDRGLGLTLTIVRGGNLIARDVPARGHLVQVDDRVRVRVLGAEGTRYATLESWEGEGWAGLYEGDIPDGGLLPVGLAITAGATRLRLTVCNAMDDTQCNERVFEL